MHDDQGASPEAARPGDPARPTADAIEAARRAAKARFEQLGEVAAGCAHDFNNVLAMLYGALDRAARQAPPRGPLSHALEEAKAACRYGAQLVEQMLSGQRTLGAVDLSAVVRDAQSLAAELAGPTVRIETDLDTDLRLVRANRVDLVRMLTNLVLNARDAMPRGGRIVVQTRNERLVEADATIRPPLPAGEYAVLHVSDTGTGIDEQTQQQMFEPFFTTKIGQHEGIGLTTVTRIVANCRGGVRVKSSPGVGSVFEVLLPTAS